MSLKAKVEAIIYAAEEPVTLEQLATLLREPVLADLAAALAGSAANGAAPSANENTFAAETAQLEEIELQALPESGYFDEAEDPVSAVEAALSRGGDAEAAAEAQATDTDESTAQKRQAKKTASRSPEDMVADRAVRERLRQLLAELIADYDSDGRGMEIRQIAGGYRMATKPEHHDVIRAFAKSLKPPIRLSLAALETLAVIAYKQPVTAPEIAEIRGVDSAGVLGTLLDRRLITTAGRKQVIGRPMQYRTSKDFLIRFGLNDVNELPSMEEFSQLASEATIEIAAETQQAPSLFSHESAAQETEESQAQGEAAEAFSPEDEAPSGD